jgi:hypothetical protein
MPGIEPGALVAFAQDATPSSLVEDNTINFGPSK